MFAHHVLDAINGRGRYRWRVHSGTKDEQAGQLLDCLRVAEKFDFGVLPLEEREPGKYILPDLTTDERTFWKEGLIPAPAEVCWYEWRFPNNPDTRAGIAMTAGPDLWTAMRVDMIGDKIWFDGVVIGVNPQETEPSDDASWSIMANGNKDVIRAASNAYGELGIAGFFGSSIVTVVYLTLMLNSRTTELRHETPPPKLNKARVRRGLTPLSRHTVVTLVPKQYIVPRRDGEKGTHASPCLHFRRSHKRHFKHQTAHAKWMPDEMWMGERGWWVTVIPRYIVGQRELGEITHDYVVKHV